MSRQLGEPVSSYISRYKRWYKRLTLLDGDTQISENIRSDYLMDNSRIPDPEKLSIRTTTNFSTELDAVAKQMQQVCRDIHVSEKSRSAGDGGKLSPHTCLLYTSDAADE